MKLLYLEDNPFDADLARRALSTHAAYIDLQVVGTVRAAIDVLDGNPFPCFDVLLLDVCLPDGEGLEVLRHVRRRGLPCAVVLMTGSGDETTVVMALKLGADDYVVKREDYLDRLPRSLERALHRFRAEAARRSGPLAVLYAEQNSGDVDLTERFFRRHSPHIHLTSVAGAQSVIVELTKPGAPPYDVLLLDYRLAGMDALELIKSLREQLGFDIPVVLVTGRGSEDVAAQALRLGVTDYVIKDSGYLDRLPAVLEHAHAHAQLLRERGRLEYLATFDGLTGLLNRMQFCQHATRVFTRVLQQQQHCAVILIDLDNFKYINDTFGHPMGDAVLHEFATRLRDLIREGDCCGRFGGDEFLVLLERLNDAEQAARSALRIANSLQQAFMVNGQDIVLSASIGISMFPDDGRDIDTLIRNADTAMYKAKAAGRNHHCFFAASMNEGMERRFKLEADLRHALDRHELFLEFQPQFDTRSLAPVGLEALIRWRHPRRGLVSPVEFIPVAEQCGLIASIGEWVFRAACQQVRKWRSEGFFDIKLAVNVSPKQLRAPQFIAALTKALAEFGLGWDALELELTESAMADDNDDAIAILHDLKTIGAQVAIDDFGTGYSSLAYLRRFPISKLKIDRSFVRDIPADPEDAAIATAVITLAHSLGMVVVAEGVETLEQLEFLRGQGCDHAQGFLLSRPVDAAAIAKIWQDHGGNARLASARPPAA